jgi:release factor glutamine methyltransferase
MLAANKTIADLLGQGREALTAAGVDRPGFEAELLLAHARNCDRIALMREPEIKVDSPVAARFNRLLEARSAHVPAAYLMGEREFMSLAFEVTDEVLIPRPETEMLVEEALKFVNATDASRGLDMGTGSGCIAVSLLYAVPGTLHFQALDISPEALLVAGRNARRHGVDDRLLLIESDLFEHLDAECEFDCITANLPYIAAEEMETLMPEVRDYEPAGALVGGEDGLDLIRTFLNQAWCYLAPGGRVFMEIGCNQGEAVRELVEQTGCYETIRVYQDYAGLDRLVTFEGRGLYE